MKKSIILLFLIGLLGSSTIFSQNVYITKSGEKYHSVSCRYLKYSKIKIELSSAKEQGYAACKICKPTSIGKSNTKTKKYKKSKASSGRCSALTKKGRQCKRNAKAGSSYCWQHG